MKILFRSLLIIVMPLAMLFLCDLQNANAVEMRNKLGYVSFFPFSRGIHFEIRPTNLRIGRGSYEIGWYDDGGIGFAKVWRTSSAPYFTFGPVFGSFDTFGIQAGAGLAYKILSFINLRAEFFAVGTAKNIVDGTGKLGVTAHF